MENTSTGLSTSHLHEGIWLLFVAQPVTPCAGLYFA